MKKEPIGRARATQEAPFRGRTLLRHFTRAATYDGRFGSPKVRVIVVQAVPKPTLCSAGSPFVGEVHASRIHRPLDRPSRDHPARGARRCCRNDRHRCRAAACARSETRGDPCHRLDAGSGDPPARWVIHRRPSDGGRCGHRSLRGQRWRALARPSRYRRGAGRRESVDASWRGVAGQP